MHTMKLLDYYFYRTYLFQKARGNPALFGGSLFTTLITICFSAPIWLPVFDAITNDKVLQRVLSYSFLVVCFVFSYYRYKREKDRILREFKDSKYNKLIPNWCFAALVPISCLIGAIGAIYISRIFQ